MPYSQQYCCSSDMKTETTSPFVIPSGTNFETFWEHWRALKFGILHCVYDHFNNQ